jgi:hypothetical protein
VGLKVMVEMVVVVMLVVLLVRQERQIQEEVVVVQVLDQLPNQMALVPQVVLV